MKKLTILFILLVSTVMFSSPSYAEWTKVTKTVDGDTLYVDFESIRKHGGYFYYWYLLDYLKPTFQGYLSSKGYIQGDCKLFRLKYLTIIHHNQPMGRDAGNENNVLNPDMIYPSPNTAGETILKSVCSR